MTKTYEQADRHTREYIAEMMRTRRPDLAAAKVTVSALMVGGGLKHHGYASHAAIKVNSLKDRAEGKADCTIELDGDNYAEWKPQEKAAIVHHELLHLELVKDEGGRVEKDDLGRPKLKIRLHDIEIGGFTEIIEQYRESAPEAQAIANAAEYVQGMFKF